MSKGLKNKVVVVTGASKGLGAEIAKQFGAAGAKVVVNYASSKSGADKVVADVKAAGGQAVAVQGDVSKEADVVRLFEETNKAFGPVDVLVNNAGIYNWAPLEAFTVEDYQKQFGLNVGGLLLASREAVKHFGDRGGSIINISSAVVSLAPPHASVYGGTKGAVDTITRGLANELGGRKIRVNAVSPGLVLTEGAQAFAGEEAEFKKQYEQDAPLGRIGRPDDIAPIVVFLASDDASWITGEIHTVSGGVR